LLHNISHNHQNHHQARANRCSKPQNPPINCPTNLKQINTNFSDKESKWGGYSDSNSDDPIPCDINDDIPPFSNPPPGHKLLITKYSTLNALMVDLHEFYALARFSVVKEQSNNYIKGFRPSRVNLNCAKGRLRKPKGHSHLTSTSKVDCT
jgi:hypothetical protein